MRHKIVKYKTGGFLPKLQQAYRKAMVLLDHEGNPQMYMQGGELIFSRPSTKEIIDHASTGDLYNLGKTVIKERMAQMERAAKERQKEASKQ